MRVTRRPTPRAAGTYIRISIFNQLAVYSGVPVLRDPEVLGPKVCTLSSKLSSRIWISSAFAPQLKRRASGRRFL